MKLITYLTIVITSLITCSNQLKFNITGKWTGFDKDSTSFEIDIVQHENIIKGNYCAVTKDGLFIDCWLKGDYDTEPLNGKIDNNKIKVIFDIAYSEGKGFATLAFNNEKQLLTWKLDSSNEVTYCPELVELKKIK